MTTSNKHHLDSCPWHPDVKFPTLICELTGHRDDPRVVIRISCPTCKVTKNYFPTEREVQDNYTNRYSENKDLIKAVFPKIQSVWNWKHLSEEQS